MAHIVQPRRTFITLDSFLTTIFLSSSLFRNFGAHGMITCSKNNTSLNPIQNRYQINLQNLLANMASNASSSSFHTSTIGESPDEAYGLYYCRGDTTTTELCHSCVVDLTKRVASETDFCVEGFGYLDNFMLRYANYSFFGKSDNERKVLAESVDNVTNVVEFNRTVRGLIEGLVEDAAFESANLFATREAVVGGGEGKVYGLAQCSPDIGRVNCNGCLKKAASYLQKCCEPKMSVWAMFPSCQLRYDNSSFYRKSGANGRAVSGSLLIAGWTVLLLLHWLV